MPEEERQAATPWLQAPDSNRVRWLDRLAAEPDPAALELLRLHLWDSDPLVRSRALELLEARQDAATILERWRLLYPETDLFSEEGRRAVDALMEALPLPVQLQVVTRARLGAWRAEFRGISLWKAAERLKGDLDPGVDDDWTKRFQESGGSAGIVGEDGVSVNTERQSSVFTETQRAPGAGVSAPNDELEDVPFRGAWAIRLSSSASGAIVHEGRWFAADGGGFLVKGSMATGQVLWRVPIPLPPSTRMVIAGNRLRVRARTGKNSDLVLEFSIDDGALLRATVEPAEAALPLGRFGNGDALVAGNSGGSWTVSRSSGGAAVWSIPTLGEVSAALVNDESVFVALCYGGSAGIARLRAIDGSTIWARSLDPASWGIRFCGIEDNRLWIFDRKSWTAAIDVTSGALLSHARWTSLQFTGAVTNLSLDRASGRFLLDPSNGFVYGIPPERLAAACGLAEPDRRLLSVGEALGDEVFVGTLDIDCSRYMPGQQSLFGQFANRFEHGKFCMLAPKPRQEVWDHSSKALIAKAERRDLDVVSLRAALAVVEPERSEGVSYAPTGAWRIRYDGEEAWAIVCNWENEGWHSLGHIAIWAVSIKTGKILGFETCG